MQWLQEHSAAGELFGVDYTKISLNSFYRISDTLLKHKKEFEYFLYQHQKTLFGFEETITLYDLTNTYFEGGGPQALRKYFFLWGLKCLRDRVCLNLMVKLG